MLTIVDYRYVIRDYEWWNPYIVCHSRVVYQFFILNNTDWSKNMWLDIFTALIDQNFTIYTFCTQMSDKCYACVLFQF